MNLGQGNYRTIYIVWMVLVSIMIVLFFTRCGKEEVLDVYDNECECVYSFKRGEVSYNEQLKVIKELDEEYFQNDDWLKSALLNYGFGYSHGGADEGFTLDRVRSLGITFDGGIEKIGYKNNTFVKNEECPKTLEASKTKIIAYDVSVIVDNAVSVNFTFDHGQVQKLYFSREAWEEDHGHREDITVHSITDVDNFKINFIQEYVIDADAPLLLDLSSQTCVTTRNGEACLNAAGQIINCN